MAVGAGPDPLERAVEALRQEQPEQWPGVSETVKGRVRSLVRPAASLLTHDEDGRAERDGAGARTWVSGRVVVALLRERLRTELAAPRDVRLEVDVDRCRAVEIDLVGAYGADLHAVMSAARTEVLAVLAEVLGVTGGLPADVRLRVVDVVVGDPRIT